jgi:hypothetical protein
MDDATGTIYSAFLIDEEGTASTFWALNEVFGRRGLPMSLYTTDRGAHISIPPRRGTRSTAAISRKWAGRSSSSASSISAPIRRLFAA